jgi:hypothetical protein
VAGDFEAVVVLVLGAALCALPVSRADGEPPLPHPATASASNAAPTARPYPPNLVVDPNIPLFPVMPVESLTPM